MTIRYSLLAIVIGVPLGIAAGCYPRFNAFISPLVMFGRNIPLAAIIPLLIFIRRSTLLPTTRLQLSNAVNE